MTDYIDKIYNEDCISDAPNTGMNRIPDSSIDMVLCDLPFGTTQNKWDVVIPFEPLWKQYRRVTKKNAAIVLFADGMFTSDLMQSNRAMWRYNMVWKRNEGTDFLNANVKPLKIHQDICVFYAAKPTYNKQVWKSKPYVRGNYSSRTSNYGKHNGGVSASYDGARNPVTVLEFGLANRGFHPNTKPVELCEWLIKTYSNEGDVVLDNTFGSGTTLVAAIKNKRHYVGFETDVGYFEIAQKRIDGAMLEASQMAF